MEYNILSDQQYKAQIPIVSLHQENFSVLINFVNEFVSFSKVSNLYNNTLFISTMSIKK